MSFEEQNLVAFVQLLQEQPQLFTDPKRQELLDLIEPLADDTETLSSAISEWYEKYDDIVKSQLEILNNYNSEPKLATSDQRLPGSKGLASPPPLDHNLNKSLLKNMIVQSQTSVKKTQTQS